MTYIGYYIITRLIGFSWIFEERERKNDVKKHLFCWFDCLFCLVKSMTCLTHRMNQLHSFLM